VDETSEIKERGTCCRCPSTLGSLGIMGVQYSMSWKIIKHNINHDIGEYLQIPTAPMFW